MNIQLWMLSLFDTMPPLDRSTFLLHSFLYVCMIYDLIVLHSALGVIFLAPDVALMLFARALEVVWPCVPHFHFLGSDQ